MTEQDNSIAIIGMWCRLPGAGSPQEFWRNLCEGKVSIAKIDRQTLIDNGVPPEVADQDAYVPYRGILEDAMYFDAASFRISPAEARLTDPQHRQFLECTKLALDDAGIHGADLKEAGVFAAQSRNNYQASCGAQASAVASFSADIFNGMAHLATSVAYRLGLGGPAISVQSACSSSLVAVHLACQSLVNGDCDVAIAGGVSIGWPQHVGHLYVPEGIMSKDGQCRPFDANASGTVRGEGVGVVVMQRLGVAKSEGRRIHAIIRASAVNNDGDARMGFATPSPDGQVRLIRRALQRAKLEPDDVTYLETHGTGTAVGDAVELSALSDVFGHREATQKVLLGSVKANVGHLDAAAGVTGPIKVALALSHRTLPPQAAFSCFHEESAHHAAAFDMLRNESEWHAHGRRRIAGITSLGIGGTNAHLLVEECLDADRSTGSNDEEREWIFPFVAQGDTERQAQLAELYAHAREGGLRSHDLAYTLALATTGSGQRSSRVGRTIEALGPSLAGQERTDNIRRDGKSDGSVAFLLAGKLHEQEDAMSGLAAIPAFKRCLEAVRATISQVTECRTSLATCADNLGQDAAYADESWLIANSRLQNFCVQVALVRFLTALGLKPGVVAGAGTGELAAACVAGALTIEEAAELMLVASDPSADGDFAALLQDVPAGGMNRWFSMAAQEWTSVDDVRDGQLWRMVLDGFCGDGPMSWPLGDCGCLVFGDAPESMLVRSDGLAVIHRLDTQDLNAVTRVLAHAWEQGASVNWPLLFEGTDAREVLLQRAPSTRRVFLPPGHKEMPNQRPAPVDDKVARGPHSPSAQAEKPLEEQGVQELAMAVFAEVLQQPVTSAAQHFFDLGGCSITALDVLQKMEDATGVRISLRSFLHEPTPIHLAQCIQESRSGQTMNATASSDSLRLVVQQAFEKVLQIQTPAPSANFFDLGGCSLTALDVLEHVERATSRRVGLRQFLHEPTIEALAFSLAQLGNEQELSPQPETRYSSMQHLAAADKTTEFRLSEDASGPGFSVFFFSGKAPPHAQPGIYQLLLDAARMADERGFEAIWVPERHFHSFGGLFPAPSVLAGAIAACTRRISIRAGSVVLPLHNPVSVVEEWSVVDNLSGGRVGMALAPGFHPTDFALQPDRFADRRAFYNTAVKQLKQLWRGEPYHGPDGLGREVDLVPLPRPLQRELPVWITVADSEQNFREAGEAGSNVLTALLSLDVKTLAERIAVYRQALAGRPGKVTLMLHTFVHPDADTVASVGVDALRRYLDHHLDFASQRINYEKVNKLAPSDREALVNHAVSRYLNDGSLIGTPQQCAKFVKRLIDIGVQEFACLVDFGVSTQAALDSLNEVAGLKAALAAGALA